MSNRDKHREQARSITSSTPASPTPTPSVTAPVAAPVAAPARMEPVAAPPPPEPPASAAPEGYVLARWTGLGAFGGLWFTFPAREERVGLRGPTVGFFDVVSVEKLKGQFERLANDGGRATTPAEVPSGPPPEGYVLARWTGAGRFAGALLTFPACQPRPFCVGPTVGYFPAESVEKLARQFERL